MYVKVLIAGMDRGMDRVVEPVYDPYQHILACRLWDIKKSIESIVYRM